MILLLYFYSMLLCGLIRAEVTQRQFVSTYHCLPTRLKNAHQGSCGTELSYSTLFCSLPRKGIESKKNLSYIPKSPQVSRQSVNAILLSHSK